MQEFSIGRVLSRSFSIWAKNLIPFTILMVILYSPVILYTLSKLSGDIDVTTMGELSLAMGFGGILLKLVAAAAIMYGVVQQLRGQHASLVDCIVTGFKRLFPVLGIGLMIVVCFVVVMLPVLIITLWVLPGGIVLLIIMLMFYVAVPVAVIERPGVIASLKRSKELTEGYKGSIFGILFVLGIIEYVAGKILESSFITETATMDDRKVYVWLVLAMSIVLGALGAVVNAVVYHDLRATKEGVGVEELARVFE